MNSEAYRFERFHEKPPLHDLQRGLFIYRATTNPHINDMYGFPKALYEIPYAPAGSIEITDQVIHYMDFPYANRAVPTADHFLPLPTILGATYDDEPAQVWNHYGELGSITMTSFTFDGTQSQLAQSSITTYKFKITGNHNIRRIEYAVFINRLNSSYL